MAVYLDHAATTPILEDIAKEIYQAMLDCNGNPSSTHQYGRLSRTKIESARAEIAHILGASTGEIFFTSCATEANNMILNRAPIDLGVARIISSPLEHHCILHTLERLEHEQGIEVVLLDVNHEGRVNIESLEELLPSNKKTLVSLMHVNNELGNVLDLERVAALCNEGAAYFHTDAAQGVGKFAYNLETLGAHFLTASGHKFHAPKGIGFMYMRHDAQLKPWLTGGAQERNIRSGTENLHGIIGIHKAMMQAYDHLDDRVTHLQQIKSHLKKELRERFVDIMFNGTENSQSPHILSVSFPPSAKNDMLDMLLDMDGILVSGGSACSSGSVKASHVLEAIGSPSDRKTIRFSFSHVTQMDEINKTVQALENILLG